MERVLGVGMIGCGGHAMGCNLPAVARHPGLRLVGCCDLQQASLEEAQRQFQPSFCTNDMDELVKHPEVDLVICATKPDVRLPVMELAVQHRKPLFVEKPLAYSRADVLAAVALMRDSGVPLIVGFNRPYSPLMQAVRPIFRRHRDGHTTIVYRIVGESAIWPEHHRQKVLVEKESTVIHEATHIFDLLNWLTEAYPEQVFMAGGGHVDNVITLSYPNQTTAVIIAGDNGSVGYPKERLEIDTNCGTLVGEMFAELNVCGMGDDNGTQIFEVPFGDRKLRGIEAVKRVFYQWRSQLTAEKQAVGRYFGQIPEIDKGHYGQLDYFRRQVLAGEPVETDVVRGAVASLTAEAAMTSWRENAPQVLDFSELLPEA